tara:strand:- start:2482 stop:4008 length:1527 start_codon:yes stop_codon:yes gene_type:complete
MRFSLSLVLFLAGMPGLFAEAPRPNIILMMADDMGWSDIGCYGAVHIQTPNIDRIAAEGMLFTQFYNNAKCTTTRASLLTGLYPRNGGRGSELISNEMITLGEGMRLAGYATGMSGKWHNGSSAPHRPFERGFDEAYGLWDGCCNFFDPSKPDPKFKGGRTRKFGHNLDYITEFPDDFFTTDAFTDHAIATIRAQVASGKPFLHYLPYTAPHYPIHAKPEDIAKYKGKFSAGWDALRKARRERQIEMGLIDPEIWPEAEPEPKATTWEEAKSIGEEWQNLRMEAYAAMVDNMDQNIGRVLDLLDELEIADNTLILFLSDNGACAETPGGNDPEQVPGPGEFYSHVGPGWASAQNTPLRRYKAHCHEGGVATPLVIRWPAAIAPGTKTDAVGHIIDFLPTFLELGGAEYPSEHRGTPLIPVEGRSLLPVLEGRPEERIAHEKLFWNWSKTRAMRQGDWKLVGERDRWSLYDLSRDRTETRDLSAKHPERLDAMIRDWEAWAKLTGVARK